MDIQKIKSFVKGLQDITCKEICLLDATGYVFFSTNSSRVGDYDDVLDFNYGQDFFFEREHRLYCTYNSTHPHKYFISLEGTDDEAKRIGKVIKLFLSIDDTSNSRDYFIKGLLSNAISDTSLDIQCQKHGISVNGQVQVILIEVLDSLAQEVEEIVLALYPDELLVKIKDNFFVFIKEVTEKEPYLVGSLLFDTILSELLYEAKIAIGITIDNIRDWHKSYKLAEEFMHLGKAFFPKKNIYCYDNLAIPMIINKISEDDLQEIIKHLDCNIQELFDNHELITTAFTLIKYNLNITDTSKHLFVHRNTLIYRLNKIQDITGYDLRVFQDAMLFYIIANAYQYIINTAKCT
ncbi:PucR C-terminal helix-turn-helix domain-containing protein [Natronincola peptidivorans]|uniref:PucR C-terminal helix-turn-helix domain-containing protein n=1 Tax=Natronincola peptidivorans TaxID=426128 RepID=A0A1I0GJZ5_9FIRM|nr:helix-turn-helix domain-containing protein [Natronincola peptidivorans]SET71274.1 PucR C-terminal helix-turn-helix domain-containing protein [Natronincola peptidivorans]